MSKFTVTSWHRSAYLHLEDELELKEIARFYLTASYILAFPENNPEDRSKLIWINVFENKNLHEALVLGVVKAFGSEQKITYRQIGRILKIHHQTVANGMKRMMRRDKPYIQQDDPAKNGSYYTVLDDKHLPIWMVKFTEALVQIETDETVKKAVYEDCKDMKLNQGFQVLKQEILERITLPPVARKKPQQAQSKT